MITVAGPVFPEPLCRLIALRGIVLRGLSDDNTHEQPHHHRTSDERPVGDLKHPEYAERGGHDQRRTEIGAARQSLQKSLHVGVLACANRKYTYDRQYDAHSRYKHRGDDRLDLHGRIGNRSLHECGCSECGCGKDRAAIALVEVGAHAGHVAHIVAHIVGYSRGIARIILRYAGLDFTYKVGAHVGGLGIDAASHSGEKRLRGSTHAECQHGSGDHSHLLHWIGIVDKHIEQHIPYRDVEQSQPHDNESHDSAGAECHIEASVKALTRGIGCSG